MLVISFPIHVCNFSRRKNGRADLGKGHSGSPDAAVLVEQSNQLYGRFNSEMEAAQISRVLA
jgi:hypothetical protein